MSAYRIEQAVQAAIVFFGQLYGDKGLSGVLMEEVRSVEGKKWTVTLGYNRELFTTTAQELMQGTQMVREYKIFTVDKDSGQVESVEMREA